jgi:hypothetical protein
MNWHCRCDIMTYFLKKMGDAGQFGLKYRITVLAYVQFSFIYTMLKSLGNSLFQELSISLALLI